MTHDSWNEWVGLRRALTTLLWRGAIAMVLWIALYIAVLPPLEWLSNLPIGGFFFVAWVAIISGLAAIPGFAIGHFLGRDLPEHAGFVSPVLTALALLTAGAVVAGGAQLVLIYRSSAGWAVSYTWIMTAVFAGVWLIRLTLLDD